MVKEKHSHSSVTEEKVVWFCCLDIDRRARFCFVEYDTDTAAQKAVDAENGRDFEGTTLSINHFILVLTGLLSSNIICFYVFMSINVNVNRGHGFI